MFNKTGYQILLYWIESVSMRYNFTSKPVGISRSTARPFFNFSYDTVCAKQISHFLSIYHSLESGIMALLEESSKSTKNFINLICQARCTDSLNW